MGSRGANLMQLLRVSEAMQPLPQAIDSRTPLNEVVARLGDAPTDGLPVVDSNAGYRGTVTSQQVEQALRENALDATAGDLAQDLPPLRSQQTLEDALGALLRARSGLPVVADDNGGPVGWLAHLDVLRAYDTRLQRGITQAQQNRTLPERRPKRRRITGALARLRGYRIVDLDLATANPHVGHRITDIPWPARSTILTIRRGEQAFEPDDSDRLESGDRLTVLVPAAAADDLVHTITANGDTQQ
jgi:CBS domain-containing protein